MKTSKKSSEIRTFVKNAALILAIPALLTNCAPPKSQNVEEASKAISESLGCVNVKSKIFDAFYLMIDRDQTIPLSSVLKEETDREIEKLFESRVLSSTEQDKLEVLKKEMHKLIDLLLAEAQANPKLTWKEQIQKLIEYEMEDRSSGAIIQSTENINSQVEVIRDLSQTLEISCQRATPPPGASTPAPTEPGAPNEPAVPTPAEPIKSTPTTPETPAPAGSTTVTSLYKGMNRVIATAYQSCRVLDLPEMDRSTASVSGITRTGTHEDGVGGQREITDLKAVQNSHYYIRSLATESQCASVKNNPLIYDYGGSPYVSGNTINFQKNAGSGTSVLGVDCSALVSSGIAVAGLRYKPSLENKPIYIRQSSSKFIDAEKSGFTCFQNVTVTAKSHILPGDIVGVSGHVVTIDKVGRDPFGFKSFTSSSQCSTLDYKKFDIVVAQSSPSKNGIGINKYTAKDYLSESTKMKTAFVEMGKQACLAYFQNKSIKPKSSAWGFMRHKGTAECLAPRVTMVGESCTQKCM